MLERGWTLAQAAGCSERTAGKWLRRYCEGDHALLDRSARPRRSSSRLPEERVRVIELLRRLRMTAAEITEILQLPLSTVSAWLKRIGLGKRSRLEPPEPPNRYEWRRPGELVHVNSKSSAASAAWAIGSRAAEPRRRRRDARAGCARCPASNTCTS